MESGGDVQGESLSYQLEILATVPAQITVNYLQVIAVAVSVNVDWTETLVGVFETAGD